MEMEWAMKGILKKALLAFAIGLWTFGIGLAAQTENRDATKAETQAVEALTKLKVPLQHDSNGAVRWIEATDKEFSDEAMSYLPRLGTLEWLEIGGGSVTSAGISQLKGCLSLKRLYIHDINLEGDDLSWVSALTKLEALSLQRTRLNGNALKNLKGLGALVVLNLSDNSIGDEDIGPIAELKRLEVLSLANTRMTGNGVAKLEGMERLNELNLVNTGISDRDLEYFLTMPNLRIVYAAGCNLSDIAIHTAVSRFPMLAIFR
jgi:hypothetical protein